MKIIEEARFLKKFNEYLDLEKSEKNRKKYQKATCSSCTNRRYYFGWIGIGVFDFMELSIEKLLDT